MTDAEWLMRWGKVTVFVLAGSALSYGLGLSSVRGLVLTFGLVQARVLIYLGWLGTMGSTRPAPDEDRR